MILSGYFYTIHSIHDLSRLEWNAKMQFSVLVHVVLIKEINLNSNSQISRAYDSFSLQLAMNWHPPPLPMRTAKSRLVAGGPS